MPSSTTPSSVADELDRLSEKYNALDFELAAAAGVSPTTIRFVRLTRRTPRSAETLRAIQRLIERAKTAPRRCDLTLAAHPLRRGAK
jgi:hypothetical protein